MKRIRLGTFYISARLKSTLGMSRFLLRQHENTPRHWEKNEVRDVIVKVSGYFHIYFVLRGGHRCVTKSRNITERVLYRTDSSSAYRSY